MYNPYNPKKSIIRIIKKLDYTDYTLNIRIIFFCDYHDTDYIFFENYYPDYTDYM